jgi:hypothetical protein
VRRLLGTSALRAVAPRVAGGDGEVSALAAELRGLADAGRFLAEASERLEDAARAALARTG